MAIQTINPATNEIIESFDEMNDKAVDSAVEQASKAFDSWRKTSYQQRAEVLHKVAELMRENKDKYAKMITLEMGKVIMQAEGEIDLSADIFDYYATNGEAFLADNRLIQSSERHLSEIRQLEYYLVLSRGTFHFIKLLVLPLQTL